MSDTPLADRRVVVTGASSGIGRAVAVAVARAGADVCLTFRRNGEGARATADGIRALGRRAEVLPLDLTDAGAPAAVVDEAFARLGTIDGWVNNAGADILTGDGRGLSRVEKLDLVLQVDLRGTVLVSWLVAERMVRQPAGGTLLNVSWDHVGHGLAGENPMVYAAGKGGLEAFSKSLARSVAPRVRVNVLAPGFVATAFEETATPEWRSWVEGATPLQRWGDPDDVAAAAVYLLSPGAGFVTGQTLMINGGVVM